MESSGPREKLLAFLETVVKPGRSVTDVASDDTNLVQEGIMDSFALIQIIFFLEQDYQLNLQKMDIDPTDLMSIRGMLAAIDRSMN